MHNRQALHWRHYNYAQNGAYFITITTQNRARLFGQIINGTIHLNLAGKMIADVWNNLHIYYPTIITDAFIVMPDHFHGIIIIDNSYQSSNNQGQAQRPVPTNQTNLSTEPVRMGLRAHPCPNESHPHPFSLFDCIRNFKSLTTHRYIDGVNQNYLAPFHKRLWQQRYYETIIKSYRHLKNVRTYITNNPLNYTTRHNK